MSRLTETVQSSVATKAIVALLGLGLMGFLAVHLAGNLLFFRVDDAFNSYSETLHHQPWIPVVEVGLLALFAVHIILTLRLWVSNRDARGAQRYAVAASKQNRPVGYLASRTMPLSGVVVLVFLAVHIYDFRLQRAAGQDMKALMATALADPLRGALYVVGGLLVGWHLFHGVRSAARTLGFSHPRWDRTVEALAALFAVVLGLGFASIPFTILLRGG